jgi:uncharacterized membrane protein
METGLLTLHILAGLSALAAGFLALYAEKGRWVHRRFGRAFAIAMITMTTTAAVMALTFRPNRINVIAASITFYLVVTGLLTVIRKVQDSRRLHAALLGLASVTTLAAWRYGVMALHAPGGAIDHIPAGGIFMFATIGTLGMVGDLRLLHAGAIEGVARLRRHLWRMTYAMWIATTSFFFGQARHLPDWIRSTHLNAALIFLVLGTLLYWLVRVGARTRRRPPPIAAASAAGVGDPS